MSAAETLIVIFVFGVAMSFLVAKGIWEARDFRQREIEREKLTASRGSLRKPLREEPAISG